MPQEEWKPIEIVRRDPKSDGGMVRLNLELSCKVDLAWIKLFDSANISKTGTAGYALTDTAPQVMAPGLIIWKVPDQDTEDAFQNIRSRIHHANANYPGVIRQRQLDEENKVRAEVALAEHNAELKRRLDSL